MRFTREVDYAVKALVELAERPSGRLVKVADLAAAHRISHSYLSKIMQNLSRQKIIHSVRGVGGGVRLSRDPRNISLLEVIEAIDGPIVINPQALPEYVDLHRQQEKSAYEFWRRLQSLIVSELAATAVSDLTASPPS